MRPAIRSARFGILLTLAVDAFVSGCLCPTGQLLCDGECVDPLTSQTHCGGCGVRCSALQRCDAARCVQLPTCGPTAPAPIECDDGNPCNGVHECFDGRCIATRSPLTCSDGVTCTVSSCEPASGCVHRPDDALCDEGQFCDPSSGCVEPCPYSPCSIVRQCGCFEGDKCSHEGGSTGACVLTGTRREGSACAESSECAAGLLCISLPAFDVSRCSVPCASAEDCSGRHCFTEAGYETSLGNGERFSRCEDLCDPVDARECAPGLACMMLGSDTVFTYCGETDASGEAGQPCEQITDCAPGHTCVRYSDRTACGELCHDDRDCSGGRRCFDFATPITVHGERVGSCG